MVLTGDFNTPPNSAPYNAITKNLEDAFQSAKYHIMVQTQPIRMKMGGFSVSNGLGGRRIDYILQTIMLLYLNMV